jgi:hypothetical protein
MDHRDTREGAHDPQTPDVVTPPLASVLPKWSTEEALRLRLQNRFTLQQIADHFGLRDRRVVHKRLRRFLRMLGEQGQVEAFREQEAGILDSARLRVMVELLDEGRLKKATPQQLTIAYGILFDKMRLLRGLSTSNMSLHASIIEEANRPATPAPCEAGTEEEEGE